MGIKKYIKQSEFLSSAYILIQNHIIGGNKFAVKDNRLILSDAVLKHSVINISGKNNTVEILKGTYFNNSRIIIYGNNNHIRIGENAILNSTELHIEDDGNLIDIGNKTTIEHNTEIATIEGNFVKIGEDCMISSDVRICTGDSHSLVDGNGRRINDSKSITIGNHVWIGMRAVINKGTEIVNNCTVGACSLLSGKKYEEPYVIIAGVPAKVINRGVDWRRERL